VVGDSFTFGDQVSNHETWPACLERKTGTGVANAGVFGYGGAQSVLRARLETGRRTYGLVILSVLVEETSSAIGLPTGAACHGLR
jgi:hypothetical protein